MFSEIVRLSRLANIGTVSEESYDETVRNSNLIIHQKFKFDLENPSDSYIEFDIDDRYRIINGIIRFRNCDKKMLKITAEAVVCYFLVLKSPILKIR